jgi:hypothetical protein
MGPLWQEGAVQEVDLIHVCLKACERAGADAHMGLLWQEWVCKGTLEDRRRWRCKGVEAGGSAVCGLSFEPWVGSCASDGRLNCVMAKAVVPDTQTMRPPTVDAGGIHTLATSVPLTMSVQKSAGLASGSGLKVSWPQARSKN